MDPLKAYEFNPNYSWEYNLDQIVRWNNSDDVKDDVTFFVKVWLGEIAKQEGYELTKINEW